MKPTELGEHVAQLVWENFSDFIADGGAESLLTQVGRAADEEGPDARTAEEILIFFMWAHTRGVQQAFMSRVPEPRLRSVLDALHRAIFEDMVAQGTPDAQLPFFEQRVAARYAVYNPAAAVSDVRLGEAALQHIAGTASPEAGWSLAERAIMAANPLRDFLEDVDLDEE